MALRAAALPFEQAPYDLIAEERTLAVAVVRQACADLRFGTRRAEATRFLLEGFWSSWWRTLLPGLNRAVVIAYVHAVLAQAPRKVDVTRPPPAPSRAVGTILKTWRTRDATRGSWPSWSAATCDPCTSGPGRPRVAPVC